MNEDFKKLWDFLRAEAEKQRAPECPRRYLPCKTVCTCPKKEKKCLKSP